MSQETMSDYYFTKRSLWNPFFLMLHFHVFIFSFFVIFRNILKERATNQGVTTPAWVLSLSNLHIHLTLMVISDEYVESLFMEKMRFRNPPSFPVPRLDGKRGATPPILSLVFYAHHGSSIETWTNEWNDGNTPYRPLFFARVSSEKQETFIMRMTAKWFKAAKAHTLGRSVHHLKGDRVQPTLNSQVHPKGPTPKDWKFEVLTKMVVIQKQQVASEEWLACESFPRAWFAAIYTPRIKEEPSSGNESGSKQKHLWLIQSWFWTMIAGPLIGLFKMNPHQHQLSRHFQRRIKTTRAHSPRSRMI